MEIHAIKQMQDFLKEQREVILNRVSYLESKQIVGLVFDILVAELNVEFEAESARLVEEKKNE